MGHNKIETGTTKASNNEFLHGQQSSINLLGMKWSMHIYSRNARKNKNNGRIKMVRKRIKLRRLRGKVSKREARFRKGKHCLALYCKTFVKYDKYMYIVNL